MLSTAMWLVVVIVLTAGVLLDAGASFGRAGLHAAAEHAIDAAMHDAVADYQNRLMHAVTQSGYANAPAAIPQPLETTIPASDSGSPASRFTLAYTVAPTTLDPAACASSGANASNGPDAIAWLQCGGFVQESRVSLHVTVRVLASDGVATLAERDQFVTLRLFAEPPYSAVVGRTDAGAPDPANADALATSPHEGDVGGATIAGASPSATGAHPAGGTLIHVRYECHDGAGSCANAAPPDPDASLRAAVRWWNGNHPAP